jgi:uncharacterized membrane-anchored protein
MKNIYKQYNRATLYAFMLFLLLSLFTATTAFADNTANSRTEQDAALSRAIDAGLKVATKGPATVPLLDQASLALPKGYLFIPRKEAAEMMKATGNHTGAEFFGVVMPDDSSFKWLITIDYISSGYIKDDEAKSWNADDLLNSLKKGTEAANKERAENNFPTITITGWIEKPNYDAKSHKLIWSIEGEDSESYHFVNYNTYALGREGYFEVTLLTSVKRIEENKLDANKILSSLSYNNGKRYEDFVQGKDHIAEYGLAALVTGLVAKKLGLLALAGVFLVKVWKILAISFFVFFGKIKKLFSRNQ